ncbi:MAG: DNA ligase D [Pseudohongiella sp.]|nr:DNA ligase D [Pseudohongiella sp.]
MAAGQSDYTRKRNFDVTPEPRDVDAKQPRRATSGKLLFVIQKHHARNLHYDLRLELNGTLKSWAVPKGPSLDPDMKRLAVHVEDHPISYAKFEGDIPEGEYGAGHMIIWDTGIWKPEGDAQQGYLKGKLKFTLFGEKLSGAWNLIRTRFKDSDKDHWLLIKEEDSAARSSDDYDILEALPDSVGKRSRKHPSFPMAISPQLATLVSQQPAGNWLYEIKYDGYRVMTRITRGKANLFTRSGLDWTDRVSELAQVLASMGLTDSWLDGEIVVLDKNDLPDFQALQNALDRGQNSNIVYFLFDAPWLNGKDLRNAPLTERRDALEAVMAANPHPLLKFSEAFSADDYQSIYHSACKMALEGIIGKRADSPYRSTRNNDWVKLKCKLRQEFVIIGFTEPSGSREGFGALLLGVYSAGESQQLIYCGKVGSGFNDSQLKEIYKSLRKLGRKTTPLEQEPSDLTRGTTVHWVQPKQVCEVEFAQWTTGHLVRHAVFVSMREDKPATEIVRERAAHHSNKVAGATISNPERVIDEKSGTQKIDLAAFYESIADWLLPHLKSRPVSLLRAPQGVSGEVFFQKHAENLSIPDVRHLDPSLDPGHDSLLEITSVKALIGSVQMGTIEFHTWGATKEHIEKPDRITLDLDPDPELPWQKMIEATQLLCSVLDELGLQYYLKTSGGKGMHIIIPVARHLSWDAAKQFAKGISQFMAKQLPDRFVDKMGPKNRINRIFIDYLRNSRGASTVTAYSVRCRPGLPVSVPVTRDELTDLSSAAQWHTGNLRERLQSLETDPWQGYENRQRITKKMYQRLGISE